MPESEDWRVAFEEAASTRSSYPSSPSRSSRGPSPSMNGRPSSRNSNYSDGDENGDVGSSRRTPVRRAPPPPPSGSSMYKYQKLAAIGLQYNSLSCSVPSLCRLIGLLVPSEAFHYFTRIDLKAQESYVQECHIHTHALAFSVIGVWRNHMQGQPIWLGPTISQWW